MPVKRRMAKGRAHRVTEDAIAAWLAGAQMDLHRVLGLKPWETSPFDVDDDGEVVEPPLIAVPNDWPRGEEAARRLRRELLRHGPPGRVGRHGDPEGPNAD